MNRKNKGLPASFREDFKKLSVKERINVLFVTRKLLKVQKEKKALFEGEK